MFYGTVNLLRWLSAKGTSNTPHVRSSDLGPNSTALLIFVVFASTLAYFGMTVHATVHGSLKTEGVVGKLANVMVRCCCVGPEKEKDGEGGVGRSGSLARVVPVQQDVVWESTRQQAAGPSSWLNVTLTM